MTLAMSLFIHGEAVRFNRGKTRPGDYDFKFMRGSDGSVYPYVSSQCFKRYWRESLPTPPSPIIRARGKKGEGKNQVYTEGNPIVYADDDLFGYMIAGAEEEKVEEESVAPEDVEEVDESLFTAEDISDPNAFLQRLRDSENPFAKSLMEHFSNDKARIEIDKHNTDYSMPDDLLQRILDELNRVLDSNLYQDENFKTKFTKAQKKQFGENPEKKNRRLLNRALLEKVFAKELTKKVEKRDTTKRTAPIRMHALVAFSGMKMAKDFQTFSRDVPLTGKNSVVNPNEVGLYSGWLKSRILIEEHRIGKFYVGKNMDILDGQLDENIKPKEEINPYSRTSEKVRFYSLDDTERKKRFSIAVKALADIGNKQGPASGALHDGSLRPKTFIAAFMNCADSPFDYVWTPRDGGVPKIDIQRLQKAINDWYGLFEKEKIYIGMPIDATDEEIETLRKAVSELTFNGEKKFEAVVTTPRQALLKLVEEIERG